MSTRTSIINLLAQRVGFQFKEEELSPGLRRKVGELTELKQTIDSQVALVGMRQGEIPHLASKKSNNTIMLVILIVLGAVLLIVIVGVGLLVGAYFVYRERKKIDFQTQQVNAEIARYNAEVAGMSSTMSTRLTAVSQEIQGELSGTHGRTQPQLEPFQPPPITVTMPIRQSPRVVNTQPQNVQVIRETVREIVMIPCPYCKALMSQTSPKCPICGGVRDI